MTLPHATLQESFKRGGPQFARDLERNFVALDKRTTLLEARLTDWQSWTPTWTNLTKGNGTLDQAIYSRAGKTVFFTLIFTLGSTSSVGTSPVFTLPITASQVFFTNARYYDSSATTYYEGRCDLASTTTAGIVVSDVSGTYLTRSGITATVPFTWATSDQIIASGFYFAA